MNAIAAHLLRCGHSVSRARTHPIPSIHLRCPQAKESCAVDSDRKLAASAFAGDGAMLMFDSENRVAVDARHVPEATVDYVAYRIAALSGVARYALDGCTS